MRRPSRPAVRRALGRVAAAVAVLLAAPVLSAGTAAADVTVAASRAEAGARDVTITFRVTNADPAVPTTRLQVFLPTVRPLRGVRPSASSGWTARVDTALAVGAPEPIPTAVTWAGGTVVGAHYTVFPIDVTQLPDGAGPLRFRVVQTFANGATEEWSDLVPPGAPAPAHPALEIPYGTAPGVPDIADPAVDPVLAHDHHGDEGVTLPPGRGGVWPLLAVVGAAGAAVLTATGALGRRQGRRLGDRIDDPSGHDPS